MSRDGADVKWVTALSPAGVPESKMYALYILGLGAVLGTGQVVCETVQEYICSQKFTGSRIDYSKRKCIEDETTGCVNPFPYKTKEECMLDFHGKGNICETMKPCQHGGTCLPVTSPVKGRTFKCDCSETGYYGSRCQRKCPKMKKLSRNTPLQTACLQIG